MAPIRLYNFWRSSASWRVRIALGLKRLPYEYIAVKLDGEQRGEAHHSRNPMDQVPALELEVPARTPEQGASRRVMVAQSLAIIELLDELHPEPALLPADLYLRARTRELAEIVNAGIQPHQNLSPMARIDELQKGAGLAHARHFNAVGLTAFEARVQETKGRFCVGERPGMADLCLIPQLATARRIGVEDVDARFPTLVAIERECMTLPAFIDAVPERQPDAKA